MKQRPGPANTVPFGSDGNHETSAGFKCLSTNKGNSMIGDLELLLLQHRSLGEGFPLWEYLSGYVSWQAAFHFLFQSLV